MSRPLTKEELALCVLLSVIAYRFTKWVFCSIRNKINTNKNEEPLLTEWQRGFYFAEEEILGHPYGYVTIEDILHEVAMDNISHEECYIGMADYLDLYYKRRET